MSKKAAAPAVGMAGMTDDDIEEWRINRLRQDISLLLQELATEAAPEFRRLALKRLVGVAIEACGYVMHAGKTSPDLAKTLAAGMTYWPVLYSVFPGESDELATTIEKLGVGSAMPLALKKKWRLKATGTRWAFAYWQLVDAIKVCRRLNIALESKSDGWVQTPRGSVLQLDIKDAIALPDLSSKKEILRQWEEAYGRHLGRHFPGDSVIDHKDWKSNLAGKTGRRTFQSVGAMRRHVLDEVARGFRVIAPKG